jgi:hypothetical protein
MTVARRCGAALFAVTAVAMGCAAPASAIVPPADGTYAYVQDGAPPAIWQVQTICIQANGTRAQPDYSDETIQTQGCTVVLRSFTPQAAQTREERLMTFASRARLSGGMWTFQISSSEGLACPDGSSAATTETFAFAAPDPQSPNPSVTGTRTSIHGAECGLQPGMVKAPFELNFTGPPGAPIVSRFPAQCDYLAGRPSICS